MLVPSIHSSKPNPYIDLRNSPFHVQQVLAEWRRHTIDGVEIPALPGSARSEPVGPMRISSWKEYSETGASPTSGRHVLIPLSAKKDSSLKTTAAKLAIFSNPIPTLRWMMLRTPSRSACCDGCQGSHHCRQSVASGGSPTC